LRGKVLPEARDLQMVRYMAIYREPSEQVINEGAVVFGQTSHHAVRPPILV
jgi:hypothetical protein